MLRLLVISLLGVAIWTTDATVLLAQDAWPATPPPFTRGTGGYLNAFKILLAFALFAIWVKTCDWISQDADRVKLPYSIWNPVVVAPFAVTFLLLFLLPWYWLGFGLMCLAYLAPTFVYVSQRNKQVEHHQRVLTTDHMRHLFAGVAGKVGVKVETERKEAADLGPPVKFTPLGGANDSVNQMNLIVARQSPAFVTAKEVVADMLDRRGDGLMLDFSPQSVGVKYQIDGVWHDLPPRDRATSDPLLAVLKRLAGRNEAERRARQEGPFGVEYHGVKYDCKIVSQGVETGERAMLSFEDKKVPFKSFEELGMRQKLIDQTKELLSRREGIILLSTPPKGGLSTLFYVALRESDRYMRDYHAIEDAHKREREVENLHVHTFNSAARENALTKLPEVVRLYPNALVLRELSNAELVNYLIEQTKEERLVLAANHAKEAVESLLRVLMLKVAAKDFAPANIGVINMRLVRKLCDECKQPYAPPPELLRQLGNAKIEAIYGPPGPPQPGEKPRPPCTKCGGIGYYGRTGMFELLIMDDNLRKALVTTPKLDVLRTAARKAGMRTLQEEGVLLVAKGVTSLQELMRVLKQ